MKTKIDYTVSAPHHQKGDSAYHISKNAQSNGLGGVF